MIIFRRFSLLGCAVLLSSSALAQEATQPTQGDQAPAEDINPPVLMVNGDTIYAAEISMVMANIAGQMGGRDQVTDEEQLLQMATQRVVEQKLLAQEALRFGIEPDELRIAQVVQAAEQQAGSREALLANLDARGSSYDQLVGMIREMDLVRTFIETKISPTIQVSDEEVEAFYTENPELFKTEEQVHARHILFASAEGADAETENSARTKAEAARQRALAGEDFATLAMELSEGPSAPNGGDLGFFSRDQMVAPFSEAAFALEPGEISEVVQTRFGFHVIQVEERRVEGTTPIEESTDQVRSFLGQQKIGQAVRELLESLTAAATIEPLLDEPAPASEATGGAGVPE